MNPIITDLLNAVEDYQDKITDGMYMDLMNMLQKYHNESAEGIDAERRQREQQLRDDEAAARQIAQEIHVQDIHTTQGISATHATQVIHATQGIHASEPHQQVVLGNVFLYYSDLAPYLPDYMYHQVNYDGRHTVRNPKTGIYVLVDGKKGKEVLYEYGYSVSEFYELLAVA